MPSRWLRDRMDDDQIVERDVAKERCDLSRHGRGREIGVSFAILALVYVVNLSRKITLDGSRTPHRIDDRTIGETLHDRKACPPQSLYDALLLFRCRCVARVKLLAREKMPRMRVRSTDHCDEVVELGLMIVAER